MSNPHRPPPSLTSRPLPIAAAAAATTNTTAANTTAEAAPSSYFPAPPNAWDPLDLRDPRRLLSTLRHRFRYRVPRPLPDVFDVNHADDDLLLVASWLTRLGLGEYAPAFIAAGVTPATLLSVTSSELRHQLGVTRLAHRRLILVEVARQREQQAPLHLGFSTPEHGRILTHLSNDRLLLLWVRVAVVMLTLAVASVGLTPPELQPYAATKIPAIIFVALAIVAVVYAFIRFLHHIMIANYPTLYPIGAERMWMFIPFMATALFVAVILHRSMAQHARDISALLVVSML